MSELGKEELLEELQCAFYNYVLEAKMKDGLTEFIKKREQAYYQIKALIQKKEVTEEWIEEKAERFMLQCPGGMLHNWASVTRFIKDFIRSLVGEIRK